MRVAALVSGGVDSSVVVHLLKEQGINPDIFYIRIGMEDAEGFIDCPAEEDIEITSFIAKKYGCRFEEVNLHKEYWDNVVSYTIDSVRKGLTPNPDVMCNRLIKFGAFEDKCGKDYDRIATGHYAQTTQFTIHNSQYTFLSTAKDPLKDQTDFLTQLTYPQIAKAMFPIGHLLPWQNQLQRLLATLFGREGGQDCGARDGQGAWHPQRLLVPHYRPA